MAGPLSHAGIELHYRPTLSEFEYQTLHSDVSRREKLASLAAAARRLRRDKDNAGLSLIQRLLFPARLPGLDPPARLDAYDFDDALFLGSISDQNRGASMLKQEARRWRAYVRRARLVTAGNAYLAGQARAAGARRVELLPSCVEPARYELAHHDEREVITIGWIGSQTTAAYIGPVMEAVANLHAAGHRVRLRLVGAGSVGSFPWLEGRQWALDREAADLAGFDIGVMPMPDTAWARGKCGYKLLQYFAAGVPAIASPVGVGTEMIGSERGLLARSVQDWERAIVELAADREARRQIGATARAYVEDHFSYSRWAPEFASMLKEL